MFSEPLSKLVIFVLVLGLFALARKARPATDQQGSSITPPTSWQAEPAQLTVASFNIQSGKSAENLRDISRSAKAVIDADIVGLQEVLGASWLNKAGVGAAQIKHLAGGNFGSLFAATRRRWFREHRGNAMLSKLAIDSWKVVMLPDQTGKQYRNMIVATFTWQGETVTFINTHLHTGKGREQQLEEVLKEFARHPRAILVGDFNSPLDTPLLIAALAEDVIEDAIEYAALDTDNPRRIDWILSKGFNVASGAMLPKGVSDHPYYQVTLNLK
jgi:endonuclease/exonuclease/phosphatase family metal-dependent hydrolase